MLGILDKKFSQWTHGKNPLQSRIYIYEKIRDIPYAVIPSINDANKYIGILKYRKGSCTPKHLLLGHMYEKLGLSILYTVIPFKWDHTEIEYPSRLRKLAEKLPLAYHLACRVDIDGKLILVDATLDPALEKLGLTINKFWDGIGNTRLPIIPEGEEQLYHPSEVHLLQKRDPDKDSMIFYRELNRLLENGRHL